MQTTGPDENVTANVDVYDDADMFANIAAFWGNDTYVDFQKKLRRQNRVLLFALRLFARAVRTAPTRVVAMAAAIILHPHLLRFDTCAEILFYGPTENNRKVLVKLGTLFPEGVSQDYAVSKASLRQRLAASIRYRRLWQMAKVMSPYRSCNTLLAMQLLLTAAARIYFETTLAITKARIVVLANDHSPMQVALFRATKARGLLCLYRQHAPISPLYPSLKFDLSVLSNQASYDTYQKSGRVEGDTIILSDFPERPTPLRMPKKIATVGKCLSRVWNPRSVNRRLRELCANPDVSRIIVRRHPHDRSDLSDLCFDPKIQLVDPSKDVRRFANECDLVVVPGSGIAVELLHAGTPTFYAGDMDMLGYDPHGFVRSGLLPDITNSSFENLSTHLAEFFDSNWEKAFATFDATATISPEHMELATRKALSKLLENSPSI